METSSIKRAMIIALTLASVIIITIPTTQITMFLFNISEASFYYGSFLQWIVYTWLAITTLAIIGMIALLKKEPFDIVFFMNIAAVYTVLLSFMWIAIVSIIDTSYMINIFWLHPVGSTLSSFTLMYLAFKFSA
jgi:hypothetical protein